MANEEMALAKLLEYGHFDQEEAKVQGIAKRAISHGFDNLSQLQQGVLSRFLTRECERVTDPGDHHNGCEAKLEGEDLANALNRESWGDGFICESCNDESEEHQRQWDKMNDD